MRISGPLSEERTAEEIVLKRPGLAQTVPIRAFGFSNGAFLDFIHEADWRPHGDFVIRLDFDERTERFELFSEPRFVHESERNHPGACFRDLLQAPFRSPAVVGGHFSDESREIVNPVGALRDDHKLLSPRDGGKVLFELPLGAVGHKPGERVFDAVLLGNRENAARDPGTEELFEHRNRNHGVFEQVMQNHDDQVVGVDIPVVDQDVRSASDVFEISLAGVTKLFAVPALREAVGPLNPLAIGLFHRRNSVKELEPIHPSPLRSWLNNSYQ